MAAISAFIGSRQARDCFLTGDRFGAEEARRIYGDVERVDTMVGMYAAADSGTPVAPTAAVVKPALRRSRRVNVQLMSLSSARSGPCDVKVILGRLGPSRTDVDQ